jgi:tRNA(Ile)-lysidine synthase
MAMLVLLNRFYSGRMKAAHLEHGLRGESSLEDARFVADYCEKIGVPCIIKHGDVPRNRAAGESSEMAGRRIRYDFFLETLDREGLAFAATAHNSGDVVETMLFNLFRGAGIKGLSGIAGRRGRIVRPVIECGRDELRRFLSDSGVPWRDDETNAENRYRRNKIRNQLLPWVRSNINESVDGVLLGLAGECASMAQDARLDASGLLAWISQERPPAMAAWDTGTTRKLGPLRLASAIRAQGQRLGLPALDRHRMAALSSLIAYSNKWRFQWAGDVEVCGSSSSIGWLRRISLTPPDDVRVELTGGEPKEVIWGIWRVELLLTENHGRRCCRGTWSAGIPAQDGGFARITSVNNVLSREPAAKNGIPWWERPSRPALLGGLEKNGTIWVPGVISGMQDMGKCVIIAKVFCRDRSLMKGA